MKPQDHIKEVRGQINLQWQNYERCIELHAKRMFKAVVKPYLVKHHLSFVTGNGTWLIYKENGQVDLRRCEDEESQAVLVALDMEAPGLGDLALYMPDWEVSNDQSKKT